MDADPSALLDGNEVSVLHRDDRVAVVSKPSGLAMHRGIDRQRRPLLQLLREQFGRPVWLPHRLDRATSGAVIVAFDAEAASALGGQFARREVEKTYFALVRGALAGQHDVDHPVRARGQQEALQATSRVESLGWSGDPRVTAVRVTPRTGRRHQIRLHLRHLRHPLVGDTTYGDGAVNRRARSEWNLCRLALHAAELAVVLPDEERLTRFVAPLPQDLCDPLRSLGLLHVVPGHWLEPLA